MNPDSQFDNVDNFWMLLALSLAATVGAGSRPNPRVGAVIVDEALSRQASHTIFFLPFATETSSTTIHPMVNHTPSLESHSGSGVFNPANEQTLRTFGIVSYGVTQAAGKDHAEIVALKKLHALVDGAQETPQRQSQAISYKRLTLYVTLEPCAHFGRTPPCVTAILRAFEAGQISRVVVATTDPFKRVNGAGIAQLRAAGLRVDVGLCQVIARGVNPGFFSRIERGRPYVRVKVASSLDGVTALLNGQSQWITSREARRHAHTWRAKACGLLTGIGTVLSDDPLLTVRDVPITLAPNRYIVDSQLNIPLTAKILSGTPITIFYADRDLGGGEASKNKRYESEKREAIKQKKQQLEQLGHTVSACAETTFPDSEKSNHIDPRVDLNAVMSHLVTQQINEIMVEAGARLTGALLRANVVDEVLCYLAPTLLGQGRQWLDWRIDSLTKGIPLTLIEQANVGRDLFFRWKVER